MAREPISDDRPADARFIVRYADTIEPDSPSAGLPIPSYRLPSEQSVMKLEMRPKPERRDGMARATASGVECSGQSI